MHAPTIVHALRERFDSASGWACFAEFADGTGAQKGRAIDLLAINLWPSVQRVLAIEVKVSRNDFARELADASKRRPWEWAECWFAVAPGVAKAEEIPAGWGLMVMQADGTGLRILRHAEQRPLPSAIPLKLFLSLARRTADPAPVLPAGSWTLPSGTVVRSDDLRRLAERLHQRTKTAAQHARASDDQLQRLAQDRNRRLGAIVACLEHELRPYRVRTVDELRAALAALRSEAVPASSIVSIDELQRALRTIADQLGHLPRPGVYIPLE